MECGDAGEPGGHTVEGLLGVRLRECGGGNGGTKEGDDGGSMAVFWSLSSSGRGEASRPSCMMGGDGAVNVTSLGG